jgi:hypothetical protein
VSGELRTHARFPSVPREKGHYESFYIKACHPAEPLGIWIRHTVHQHSGQEPQGSVWFTLFDGAADGPVASKVTLPGPVIDEGAYIVIGETRFEPGRAVGSARTEQLDASWELEFTSGEEPLFHLPRDWMYRAPIPRTKLLSPYPDARFEGQVRAGERVFDLRDWRGMVGHNWGAQHAERWVWMHGAGFEGEGGEDGGAGGAGGEGEDGAGVWLDAALGRIKVGLLTTPWIANGTLSLDGERHRLGGPEKVRATKVSEGPTRCDFRLPGAGIEVLGRVEAAAKDFVGWVYADPDGPDHNTVNCSIADMSLTVRRHGQPERELVVRGGAAYELGMRETDHGIPLQPFPDG